MRLEDRLSNVLHEQADAVEVDLQELYGDTRARLATQRHRSRLPALLAAAAVAVAVTGAAVAATRLGSSHPSPAQGNERVDEIFTCANTRTVHFGPHLKDLSFVPGLVNSPAVEASMFDAPRYSLTTHGRTATYRLGNADGSLASVSRFHRVAGQWRPVAATKCVGALGSGWVDGPDMYRLGRQGRAAIPFARIAAIRDQRLGPGVLVDSRAYYGDAGLRKQTSLYVTACGRTTCLVTGSRASRYGLDTGLLKLHPDARPRDARTLLRPDGVASQVGLWAVYDASGHVTGVTVEGTDGSSARAVRFPGVAGRVFLVAARFVDARALVVHRTDRRDERFPVERIDGFIP